MTVLTDFAATALDGTERALADYAGQVVLVVNTASKCGLTPQFEGLQALYDEFGSQEFTVLGFPCGQFAGQELDSAEEIGDFCSANYGVTFPMFAKIDVNGSDTHPLFEWLKHERRGLLGGAIGWNFTKFLVGRDGQVIARYSPQSEPADIAASIREALSQPAAN
jgi:glutathione peroxidase